MSLVKEFRDFVAKGTAVDLAIGVVMGAAFSSVVNSVTEGFIRPLISLFAPNPAVGLMVGPFNVGLVITALINFLLGAVVLFVAVVKLMNALRRQLERHRTSHRPSKPWPRTLCARLFRPRHGCEQL